MKLVLNGINGEYLRFVTDNFHRQTEFVEAAVAYATKESLLFEWCWEHQIPLRFWGRFDDSVPVSPRILRTFLSRRSPNFTCKLLTHFHAKVIWWHGVGAYIGSANLTDPAWYGNIEAGCYFDEAELLAANIDAQLQAFFKRVDENASPLTDELLKAIEARAKDLQRVDEQDQKRRSQFLATTGLKQWKGLIQQSVNTALERQKKEFLDEWFSTLQILRDIGATVSKDENRPAWLPTDVPTGALADQFLHAYYWDKVIVGGRSTYAEGYERNKANSGRALDAAIDWWRNLPAPPTDEDQTLLEWAPFLRDVLSADRVKQLSPSEFEEVCRKVWSIRDHARRVSNATLNLAGDQRQEMAIKVPALAKFLYGRRSKNGSSVLDVIYYVLYDGPVEEVPNRLWEATRNDAWHIEHFGISALGELVGWALPERFPPRNNRTSKALRSLGFAVNFYG